MSRPSFLAPILAFIRQGGKEAAQGLPATPGSIRVVEEPGTLGNPTPQQVTEQSRGEDGLRKLLAKYDSREFERQDRDAGSRGMELE